MNEETKMIIEETKMIILLPDWFDEKERKYIYKQIKKGFSKGSAILMFDNGIYEEALKKSNNLVEEQTTYILQELKYIYQQTTNIPTKIEIIKKLEQTLNKITKDNINK